MISAMKKTKRISNKPSAVAKPRGKRLYTIEVALVSGPVSRDFARKNRTISRTIEAHGGHTLADLHDAIFRAFDRYDEHLYEFQFGGKRPMDPDARRHGQPMAIGRSFR